MRAWWLALLLAACGGGEAGKSTPSTLRTDLYYGYYLTAPGQVVETKGTVNLLWVGGPWGDEVAIANMKEAQLPTVLDVSDKLYQGRRYNPEGVGKLRELFLTMRVEGVLQQIVALYPMDEPDLNVDTEGDVVQANSAVRGVMVEFPELAGAKLAVIYGTGTRFGLSTYDWVGFDHYSMKSAIFSDGEYASLEASLRVDQRTLIVPGGAQGQDPAPFFNFAENNPKVVAIIPFLWADTTGFKGIRSLGVRQAYCDTGHKVLRTPTITC